MERKRDHIKLYNIWCIYIYIYIFIYVYTRPWGALGLKAPQHI